MKYPLWIINSSLALLFIIMMLFIVLSRPTIPLRQAIEAEVPGTPKTERVSVVNINKIYEEDLFDTYQKEPIIDTTPQPIMVPAPPVPAPEYQQLPQLPKPVFLDPLEVTLKGIVVLANDDTKNRAIIQNKKTLREGVFKVGDNIEDAQLIRIFSNKIIFIRSNGQQEVLYLREKDAKKDPAYAIIVGWDDVVKKLHDFSYEVNPKAFVQRVTNFAQFLDLLDITAAYRAGVNIGCRIGKQTPYSLGNALGFQDGDIVTSINNIPLTTTENRFFAYQLIIDFPMHQTVHVDVTRQGKSVRLEYKFKDFQISATMREAKPLEFQMSDKVRLLQQQQKKFAPTLKELRLQEQRNMLQQGRIQEQNKSVRYINNE